LELIDPLPGLVSIEPVQQRSRRSSTGTAAAAAAHIELTIWAEVLITFRERVCLDRSLFVNGLQCVESTASLFGYEAQQEQD
jgi:hypothetical protein